jgi:YbbR domain-containing protein
MAVFLFMFHSINLLKSKTISSKLEIDGHTNLIITNIVPESVSLTLVGEEKDIINITGDEIKTFIDISACTEKGSYRVPVQIIKTGDVLNINTLEISVEPVDIRIQLDNISGKLVGISPEITGSLADGYDIVSEEVKPPQIRIEGPDSLIDGIDSVKTMPLDISHRYSDFSILLEPVSPGPLFTIKEYGAVQYSAKIRPVYISKQFADIPLKAVNLDESFMAGITPDTGGVTLQGKYADIEELIPSEGLLTVDCSGIEDEGDFELPVTADPGESFKAADFIPKTVLVKITKREE